MSPRARSWTIALAALAGMALTARLGMWQLHRADEKRALEAEMRGRGAMPTLDVGQLAHDATAAALQHYRPVHLQGRWIADHTVYLDNRQMQTHPGFFVVTPLELAPGDVVLVQRGWVPRNQRDRTQVPPLATPGGTVQLDGRVAPPPSRLYDFGGDERGTIRQNLDLAAFSRETGLALRPLSVQQLGPPGPDGLLRDWPQPAVDVGRNIGYAFQWFSFCALVAGLYVWFQLIKPRLARKAAPRPA